MSEASPTVLTESMLEIYTPSRYTKRLINAVVKVRPALTLYGYHVPASRFPAKVNMSHWLGDDVLKDGIAPVRASSRSIVGKYCG